ncbi:hypothetical protein D0T85_02325 [Bacteroides sp. 519]|nr:hypothetical protein [Bacteroides sp. 519]
MVVDNDNDIYYDGLCLSPNNKYLQVSSYYETRDINDENHYFAKFSCGYILDIEKGEFVQSLNSMEVGGDWTYCNQYTVNGILLFDPL